MPAQLAARRHKSIQPEKEIWSSERIASGTIHAAARDFTPRHFDAEAKKLTVDIALHSAGPANRIHILVEPGLGKAG
jgi:NADPH-dependent ferric siderophore reductase